MFFKNSLKIPKGLSESVYRRTDNTMAKRKKYERANNDKQNATQKTKDQAKRNPIKTGSTQVLRTGRQILLH